MGNGADFSLGVPSYEDVSGLDPLSDDPSAPDDFRAHLAEAASGDDASIAADIGRLGAVPASVIGFPEQPTRRSVEDIVERVVALVLPDAA